MIPKYIQLKNKISEEISQKKYPLFSKLPTENELAEKYGVSRATVRQALALLAEDGIINKHWGSGNTVINTYATSKKDTVALIIPYLFNGVFTEAVEELRSSLYKEDISLEIVQTAKSQTNERQVLDALSKEVYAGYIILPTSLGLPSMNTDMYQRLLRRQLPLLFIFSLQPDLTGASALVADDYECGYMCTRHLINRGHKSLGAIFYCNNSMSSNHFSGFISAVRDSNIPLQEEYIYWLGPDQPLSDLDFYLEKAVPHISGLLCDDRSITEAVFDKCTSNSLIIPDDLALISCEDTGDGSASRIAFSSAVCNKSLGREIANAFLSLKKDGSAINTAIGYKLIQREST